MFGFIVYFSTGRVRGFGVGEGGRGFALADMCVRVYVCVCLWIRV